MRHTIHQYSKKVIILTEKLIIDVRTREEYYQNHIKDALNILFMISNSISPSYKTNKYTSTTTQEPEQKSLTDGSPKKTSP